MSMSCRREPSSPDPAALARDLESASLVRLLPRPDGDALAAAGILARALDEATTPYQVTPAMTRQARRENVERGDPDTLSVAVGSLDDAACSVSSEGGALSTVAATVADELGAAVPPELVLAGVIAAGKVPGDDGTGWLLERAEERGLSRRPGVAIPVKHLSDGLAHSLLCHADWSGDQEAVMAALEELSIDGDARQSETLDVEAHRLVASAVAIDATDTTTPDRAAATIGRMLRPYVTPQSPFETLGGYADVLDAVARAQPGIGVALAVGGDVRESALTAWRAHARQVHEALEESSTGRYDGYLVARVGDAPVVSTAQLCRDTIAPEPLVVAVGTQTVGLAARQGTAATRPTEALTDVLDGTGTATARYGFVRADETGLDEQLVIDTVREVL